VIRGSRADLERECAFLQSLSHPRILSVLGVCTSDEREQMIIMEWMENGSLSGHIEAQRAAGLEVPMSQRARWSLQCAQSILHLHALKPTMLHRDIKGANFLLDESLNIKIGTSLRDVQPPHAHPH
jgi:serine/threonine protein kinase